MLFQYFRVLTDSCVIDFFFSSLKNRATKYVGVWHESAYFCTRLESYVDFYLSRNNVLKVY
jgi:hypothetical protein